MKSTHRSRSGGSPDKHEIAAAVHDEAIVIDALAFPYICETDYLPRIKQGGVTASIVTVAYEDSFESAVRKIDALYTEIENHPDDLAIATTAGDVREAKSNGKIAIILGFQDTKPFGADLSLLRVFYRMGVRCMQLVYNGRNLLGDGCCENTDCGLSYAGREVLEEMNRLGILVDLSHCGDVTTLEAIEHSKDPVAFTHANSRTLAISPRNKTDEQLLALVQKGGVVGVTSHPAFVNPKSNNPTLDDLLNHIAHMTDLIGVEHVGLGMDFVEKYKEDRTVLPASVYWRTKRPDVFGTVADAVDRPYAKGIDSVAMMGNITGGLIDRGYRKADVLNILGGNFLRLFETVVG